MPGLIKGSGGNFIVRLDGELLYSKRQSGRFPDPGEIEKILEPKLAG